MSVVRRPSALLASLAVVAASGAAVVAAAAPAFAAAPSISGVAPSPTVGLGAGQSGHPARHIVISVTNVATSDTVTVTFPGFTGLSATVTNVDGTSHTVSADVSTSATSAVSSNFNLTLTDVTTSSSDTTPFAIVAAPALTSASPSRLLAGTTTSVTLTGTGMQTGVVASAPAQSGVTFGAVTVNAQGTSGTVSVTVGNNPQGGPLAITLTNPDAGWSTQTGAITIDTFIVSDISPATATNADANTAVPVTVTGQGIPSGSTTLRLTPTFAVTGQDVIVASGTTAANGQSWTGAVNLAAVAPGTYTVQLVNGSNTGTLTGKTFTVTAVGAPTISTVTPSSVGQGTDTTLTITGTNFARGATVTFSKTGFTTTGPVVFTSSTQIQVPIHVASNAATGSTNATNVTVTNTGGGSGTKLAAIQVASPPTITTVSPSTLGQGAATTLTITGTGFQAGATVTFATGITATGSPTITSTTQIRIPVKVASNAPNHVVVTVKNPDNGTATSTLTINAFTVTSVSPHYVSTTFSGDLTVNGSGFKSGATVTFPAGSGVAVQGNKTATVAANGLSLTIPITVSRSSAGAVDVTVTNTTTDLGTATCTGCLVAAIAPGAPTSVVASKSGTTATVSWSAVVSPRDGGAPITGYTVTVTSPTGTGIPAQTVSASTTQVTYNNLDASSDYVFAVTATNAANLTSSPATATTSRKAQLTLQVGTTRTTSGQAVPVSGTLRDVNGHAISGASVVVQRRSDTGGIVVVNTVVTDATGGWSTVARPAQNQTFFATFAGDGTNSGATSNSIRVLVAARVGIHGTFTAGGPLKVYGGVTPNKSGQTVRLIGIDQNGRVHHFGSKVLNSRSRYAFRVSLPAGRWHLQVRIGATAGNAAGQSARLLVHA